MPSAAVMQSGCVTASPPDRPEESDHSSVKSAFTAMFLGAEDDRLGRASSHGRMNTSNGQSSLKSMKEHPGQRSTCFNGK